MGPECRTENIMANLIPKNNKCRTSLGKVHQQHKSQAIFHSQRYARFRHKDVDNPKLVRDLNLFALAG
jgi:hypothetical protein